ncbi:MAG: UDP-N-acetylmuramate--L-alanine ligase [Acidimicrobiaceae bacterium]|nr:UDP-N-acetylmuramate--L-alanine ligase [Acidimicrobiaceae bacterium]MXW61560.1 UDP-N-acetylmuramate--L-alanine ligase [Acidimicrobiaceae bacterium]MXW75520.1 UDP-N-acetylmuramate--L-alanine ligase [Acidimicrobiaceae bacterium]MYC42204.1 UDP-N-acetylmuramate--L-alanine ligase [Acidimicrobiaceae bacterium]MYD05898.1 UDP-N-acetylmuramate--L-alanine ligase [Acidimicrobiaceae bacterium]
MTVDLSTPRRIHLIGAGGAGMGAIASVLAAMGHEVSGSDLKEGLIVERLRAEGIAVAIGHKAENVAEAELVAISSAIPDHNPELIAARRLGMEVLRRMDLLPAISEQRRTVAVAGTHGKTTTSSMLSMVLTEAGFQPSFIIGGDINEIGSGAVWGAGEWMVIEADESDRTFLSLGPEIAVITNIEPDHLETYGGEPSALHDAFVEFGDGAANCVMCADDRDGFALAQRLGAVTYGTTSAADYQLVEIVKSRASVSFSLKHLGEDVVSVDLPTPGLHNALNAAAAVVVALQLGAPADAASRALSQFGGVARRYEFRGEASGVTFVDDYAHLPAEVQAALGAAEDGNWKRIVAVFQPHRYSRIATLGQDFADAFLQADEVVVTDIYSAGETPRPGVTGKLVVDAILRAHPETGVTYEPHLGDVAELLAERLRPGDLCLTLGAGDLTNVPDAVLERLQSETVQSETAQ